MTDLQLAAIISQAMFVGEAYGKRSLKIDLDNSEDKEENFRDYARGMLNVLMKEINVPNRVRVVEKALQNFFAMNGY